MGKRPLTFVIGDIIRDLSLHLESFPKPGRDNPAASPVWAPGGSAFNTAAALERLRVPTGVIGRVGADAEGQAILREMRKLGIHTRNVQKDTELPTGICVIPVTPNGERTLIGARGANTRLDPAGIPEALQGIRHLHVSGYTLIETGPRKAVFDALRTARESGVTTSLDFTWHAAVKAPEAIREALPLVSVALPSASELRLALGVRQLSRAAEAALCLGVEAVAATLGAGGCRVYEMGKAFRAPSFEVQIVNTCGAGDAFNAGYICGLLEGATPPASALIGNAAGAVAAQSEHPYLSLSRSKLLQVLRNGLERARLKKHREALQEAISILSKRSSKTRRRRR